MLKVQVAELNRTALRRIGADIFFSDGETTLGSQIAGTSANLEITETITRLGLLFGPDTTSFGIFNSGELQIFLNALRSNSVASILAEPNLIALNGHEASFLAGGEFPVPVPQFSAGASSSITVEFKEFGVLLNFIPTILDDETIRLRVAPEVSDTDEANAVVIQGFFVPGLRVRRVNTTVELKQGQTLALAGLLQIELDANTNRIPGLGDLPYIGPFFSNTTHERVEKELLVMVTPFLVGPMDPQQVPALPGAEVLDPNDLEFYLLNRIEGRTGRPFRATTAWDDPQVHLLHLEQQHVCGPVGYAE
jgi:pilus assembly protein CpaC